MKRIIPIALLALLILSCDSSPLMAAVYPRDYGLLDAKTGVERYRALYNAHIDALKRNEQVDYSGIKELDLEIPKDAESIPLGRTTDFKGLVLTVRNTTKDFYLFSLANATKEVSVPQNTIDGHNFTGIKELSSGTKLLIVEDKTPWVKERKGYNHAVYRKDILLIKDGIAQNNTVMPYGVDTKSQPVCRYADVDTKQKKVSNLTFRRTSDSSYKTCLLQIDGQNNVLLKNLNTVTPANENLNGDHIIYITNSANITYDKSRKRMKKAKTKFHRPMMRGTDNYTKTIKYKKIKVSKKNVELIKEQQWQLLNANLNQSGIGFAW